ncbi:MAG: thermopsin family protease [Candidatus Thermoplasmatota archaeon]|nr:thermopsin family protease [Candidatus Thermoplasmatota archaeon]
MGIADYGSDYFDGNPTGYSYTTDAFLGNMTWSYLFLYNKSLAGQGTNTATVQLNVVLEFAADGKTYLYWIQDVANIATDNGGSQTCTCVTFGVADNIWNFSSSAQTMKSSSVSGNGYVETSALYPYYKYYSSSLGGRAFDSLSNGDLQLLVNTSENVHGSPTVTFQYRIYHACSRNNDPLCGGFSGDFTTFDYVRFPFVTGVPVESFIVDGNAITPAATFYDAEFVIGGPGGGCGTNGYGCNTTLQQNDNFNMSLLYSNGHKIGRASSAWNFGDDTAEGVSDARAAPYSDVTGIPSVSLTCWNTSSSNPSLNCLGFPSKNGNPPPDTTPELVYNTSQLGGLETSGVDSGLLAIKNASDGNTSNWSFSGGASSSTLVPGTYFVWANTTGHSSFLKDCVVTAGSTLSVSPASPCGPQLVGFISSPSGGTDVTQGVTFIADFDSSVSIIGANWNVPPPGFSGCTSTQNPQPPSYQYVDSCTVSVVGTYTISIDVVDLLNIPGTGSLTYTVNPLPEITGGPFISTRTGQADVGQTVVFSVGISGGTQPFTSEWQTCASISGGCTAIKLCTQSSPLGFATVQGTSFACTITSNIILHKTYYVETTVVDHVKQHTAASAYLGVPIDPALVLSITPSPSTGVVDHSSTFTASFLGGSGIYPTTFISWYFIPSEFGCIYPCRWNGWVNGLASVQQIPSVTGTLPIEVYGQDSNGNEVSHTLQYLVGGTALTVSIAASNNPNTVGEMTTFTATPSGGTSPYTYQWVYPSNQQCSISTNALKCTWKSDGWVTVGVTVTDAAGRLARSPYITFYIGSVPPSGCVASNTLISTPFGTTAVQFMVPGNSILGFDPTTGFLAQEIVLSNNVSVSNSLIVVNGGALVLTATDQPVYVKNSTFTGWVRDPQNLSLGDDLYIPMNNSWVKISSLTPSNAPTKVYDLQTTGFHDFIANSFLLQDKITELGSHPLKISLTTLTPLTEAGIPVTFLAAAVNNASGYTYTWSFGDGSPPLVIFSSSNRTSSLHEYRAAGNYTVFLNVTNSTGTTDFATMNITVLPMLTAGPISVSPTTPVVGENLLLSVLVVGGTGVYIVAWSGLPPGCTGGNATLLSCAPTAWGTYLVHVSVMDSLGYLSGTPPSALTIFMEGASLALSLTGTPGNAVNLTVSDNGTFMNGSVLYRQSGPPDSLSLSGLVFLYGHRYEITVAYLPVLKHGHEHGDNPSWLNITYFGCVSGTADLFHDFNVVHNGTYVWTVNLTAYFSCAQSPVQPKTGPPPSPVQQVRVDARPSAVPAWVAVPLSSGGVVSLIALAGWKGLIPLRRWFAKVR